MPSKSALTDGSTTVQRLRPGAKATACTTCRRGWITSAPASTSAEEASTFSAPVAIVALHHPGGVVADARR